MALQKLNLGQAIGDNSAEGLRSAGLKINENFTELYGNFKYTANQNQLATHNRANILMSGNGLTYTFVNSLAIEVGAPFRITVNGTGFSFDDAAVNVTYPQALQDVSGSTYTITKTGTTNGTDNYIVEQAISTIQSNTSSEPTGSDQVLNIVSLTQAEYDAGTPNNTTFYIITDA